MKVKPRIIIQYWYQNVYLLYKKQIDEGDFEFFEKRIIIVMWLVMMY